MRPQLSVRPRSDATTAVPGSGPDEALPVPPRRRSRRRTLLLLAGVALFALGWLVQHGSPSQRTGSGPGPSASVPAGQPDTALTWQPFAGMLLPVSSTHGPRQTAAGRVWGFSRDDDGAALAAVHLLVRTFPFAGSDVFVPTIDNQVVGPDTRALRRLTVTAYEELAPSAGVRPGSPLVTDAGGSTGSVAGYSVPDRAVDPETQGDSVTVDVLIRQDGEAASFTSYRVTLQWRDGDWALVAPDWGDWRSAATPLRTASPEQFDSYDAMGEH